MRFSVSRNFIVVLLILSIPGISICAAITDIKVGSHKGYSLVIVECEQNVGYTVSTTDDQILVYFPRNTQLDVPASVLNGLGDSVIGNIYFDAASGKLTVTMQSNYDLKTYANKFPFQLILDISHKPGKPAASKSKPVERKSSPPTETVKQPINETPVLNQPDQQVGQIPQIDNDEYPEIYRNLNTSNTNYLNGVSLDQKGDYNAALDEFLLAAPALKAPAHYKAALMYRKLGKPKKAIKELCLAVVGDPQNLMLRVELGRVNQEAGKESKAEDVWNDILSVIRIDSTDDLNQMASQVKKLEALLNSEDFEEVEEEADAGNGFPWLMVLVGTVGLAAILGLVKYALDRRKQGFMEYDDEEMLEQDEYADDDTEPDEELEAEESIMQSIDDEYEDEEEENIEKLMEDLRDAGVETDGLSDEKQQRIYELAKQNYSISEIARMLNMGQEEVKFILDFRTKTEDGTISLGKK